MYDHGWKLRLRKDGHVGLQLETLLLWQHLLSILVKASLSY